MIVYSKSPLVHHGILIECFWGSTKCYIQTRFLQCEIGGSDLFLKTSYSNLHFKVKADEPGLWEIVDGSLQEHSRMSGNFLQPICGG
jgi:hypothetical protein